MVHIQDLPIELLHLILSFFVSPDDLELLNGDQNTKAKDGKANELNDEEYDDDVPDGTVTLYNICLVSRKFREVAQPLLFRELFDDGLTGDLTPTVPFIRTIYRRPDLGKHIHQISILPFPFVSSGRKPLSAEDSELLKGGIKDIGLGDQEEAWISALEKSDLGVLAALLANKAPNLRGLHLPVRYFWTEPFIQLFQQNPEFLSNLESIWIESDDEMSGFDIAFYEKFLTLPRVRFSTFEYGDLFDESFPSTWLPGTLETQELAFHHCHIDAGAIKKLVQACKKLRTFTYNNFSLDPNDRRIMRAGTVAEFDAKQAHEAALVHKDTLELFHLEYAMELPDVEHIEQLVSSHVKVGSFRDFSVLHTILIPHAALPPHPQFPSSLQRLHITDCNSSIRELTQNIAADCKNGLYPKLTHIKVFAIDITQPIKLPGRRIPEGKTPEQCFLALKDMFKGTNVNFRILPYELPDFDDYDDLDLDYDEDLGFEEDFLEPGFEEYPPGADPGSGPIPPRLLDLLMQRAMRDPEFAHLHPDEGSDGDSWETDDDDDSWESDGSDSAN
ncbi:unnamed protein product [Penicillium nalgiovense]|uniref:Uncharacterized protein n=1 Tax=Penicillium nalgiovense TaxID=60175 RepID=A0A1V6YTT0_PENNA|nr:hypothetical protein PENNAL_c0011G04199 [Penicillium nalgiovense]CAG7962797.1 unnamed protein product [Penicillium nalgiovense]CAG7989391.1 unnamed protein product [Penicillium nalgiovense]CAG7994204.1 unnamed protein product [Penicillium nalgiovense]CAG8012611.1 unnamed protein product [Penicillium nalgiovense]